jgi:hypothetical protein
MSGLSAQERADGLGRRRFPGEDIKPVLGSRLINIVQIRFLAWVLASIPSGVPNPPLLTPNAWPTPAAITAAGVTMAAACQRWEVIAALDRGEKYRIREGA